MGRRSGGTTRDGAAAAPILRMRDVVPAAVIVVLLLGVAGCMGALGSGPLDVTPVAIGPAGGPDTAREAAAPALAADVDGARREPASDPAQGPESARDQAAAPTQSAGASGGLDDYARTLAAAKRSGDAFAAVVTGKPLLACGELVLDDGVIVPQVWDCLVATVRVAVHAALGGSAPGTEPVAGPTAHVGLGLP